MSHSNFHYFILNKPYNVLSQFTDKKGRKTLKDVYNFPKGVYPVGRLDMDSEGLLLLTNDKSLTDFLLNPEQGHEKEYYVLVEGIPGEDELNELRNGIIIENKKTLPAKVKIINDPGFPERIPSLRLKMEMKYSWLSITIIEGKFRQVRKMTAKIGHPTIRLIRVRIKNLQLKNLRSGDVRKLIGDEIAVLKE